MGQTVEFAAGSWIVRQAPRRQQKVSKKCLRRRRARTVGVYLAGGEYGWRWYSMTVPGPVPCGPGC